MALGDTLDVLLKLRVDLSELSKLAKARQAIKAFESKASNKMTEFSGTLGQAQRAFGRLGVSADLTGDKIAQEFAKMEENARGVNVAFKKMQAGALAAMARIRAAAAKTAASVQAIQKSLHRAQMAMLNFMFTGLNLAFIFGILLFLSPRVKAGFTAIAASMRLIATEVGQILFPILMNVAEAIRNLTDEQKRLIAIISILGTGLGIAMGLLGVFGGAVLTLISTVITLGSVLISAASVVSTIAGILGGPLILAILGAVAFFILFKEETINAFSKVWKVVEPVVDAIADVIVHLAGLFVHNTGVMIEAIGEFTRNVTRPIVELLQPVLKQLGASVILSFQAMMAAGRELGKFLGPVFKDLGKVINGLAQQFHKSFQKMLGDMRSFVNDMIRDLNRLSTQLGMGKIAEPIKESSDTLGGFTSKLVDNLKVLDQLEGAQLNIAEQLGGKKGRQQLQAWFDLVEGLGPGAGEIGRRTSRFGSNLQETGRSIMDQGINIPNLSLPKNAGQANEAIAETLNINIDQPKVEDEQDIDQMVDKIEERLEERQRRNKNRR